MAQELNEALDSVETTYSNVVNLATDFVEQYTSEIDPLIKEAYDNIEALSNDGIRQLMLRLSLLSYTFSEVKERASFKAVLAETLRKEAYAVNFSSSVGTVADKGNKATIDTSSEVVVEEIYSLAASMLKTKADEIHRVVDTLKTVLMTRLSEAKLAAVDTE